MHARDLKHVELAISDEHMRINGDAVKETETDLVIANEYVAVRIVAVAAWHE